MPITDFNAVWKRPGDLPSQIDVFNGDAVANRIQDQNEYLKTLSEGLSAADRHTLGTGQPEELEIDIAKALEEAADANAENNEEEDAGTEANNPAEGE